MPPNDARSPKASSQAARLEPRWHGSTMSAHRLCHGSFPLIGPDWLILTTQSDDRIRPFCRPSPPLAAMPALAPKMPLTTAPRPAQLVGFLPIPVCRLVEAHTSKPVIRRAEV